MSKDFTNHLAALATLADLAAVSSDSNMRSKAASLNWLKNEFACLVRERDQLSEDLSPKNEVFNER